MVSMTRLLLILVAALMASPAIAAPASCYGTKESSAEAAIRIHSELMVTALTCQYGRNGESLINLYGSFGQRHSNRLRDAESTLINFYKTNGKGGVAQLDKMRTMLGNEYAERIATNDPSLYCQMVADTVVAAAAWNAVQFDQAIQRTAVATPGMTPACVVQAKQ